MIINRFGSENDNNFKVLSLIFIVGTSLTLALLFKVPTYGDESFFYNNVFNMMRGEPLHNYFHVALTEWILFVYLLLVSFFFRAGLDFSKNPIPETYFYGKLLGFFFYIAGFFLGAKILQDGEKKIKVRTVIFSVLYFSSIGLFERFLRINSDAVSFLVYLLFVLRSLAFLRSSPTILKSFRLNTTFLFLGAFSNIKSLYLILPLVIFNAATTFRNRWAELKRKLDPIREFFILCLYTLGAGVSVVILWIALVPKPFDVQRFLKENFDNITYTTRIDTYYPIQAYNSWKFYIFDVLVEYIGLPVFFVFTLLVIFYFIYLLKHHRLKTGSFSLTEFRIPMRTFYNSPWLILLTGLIIYYFGIASATIHWSRWGFPLGFILILFLSGASEKMFLLLSPVFKWSPLKSFLIFIMLVPVLSLRFLLTLDLIRMNYDPTEPEKLTRMDTEKFLSDQGIKPAEQKQTAVWFGSPYTKNLGFAFFSDLKDGNLKDLKYFLYVPWSLGTVMERKSVDLSVHNQKVIIEKLAENVTYRFPTLLSRYTYVSRYLLWNGLSTTGVPEMDLMIEPAYGVIKLKEPLPEFKFNYSLTFNELSHYRSPNSYIFNFKNFPQANFFFPPCYSYENTKKFDTGVLVVPPPQLGGVGGQTAGLTCHSARFKFLFRGRYKIEFSGVPESEINTAKIYADRPFKWDTQTKTMEFEQSVTEASAEVGVATKKGTPDKLVLTIGYGF